MNNLYSNLIIRQTVKNNAKEFGIQDTDGNVIFTATAVQDLFFENNLKVAYEPQENGEFSSNSKQGTPFVLEVTIVVVPMLDRKEKTIDSQRNLISDAQSQLDELLNSDVIVQILFDGYLYENMTLKGLNYQKSVQLPFLSAVLFFQEVRVANVNFQPLPANKVKNPTNASALNNGQIQPTLPDSSTIDNVPTLTVNGGATVESIAA